MLVLIDGTPNAPFEVIIATITIEISTAAATMKLMTWKKQKNHTTPIPSWDQEENSIYSTPGEEIRPLPPPLLLHPHPIHVLHPRRHRHGQPTAEMVTHAVPLRQPPISHPHLRPVPVPTNPSSPASKNGYKQAISPNYNAESNQTQLSKSAKHSDPSKPS